MHTIRLRGPWNKRIGQQNDWIRIQVPEPVGTDPTFTSDSSRRCYYRRSFNRPTGLGVSTKVKLCVEGCQGQLRSVEVNQSRLDCDENGLQTDITSILQPHNEVTLCLTSVGDHPPSLQAEVVLQIEES